METQHTRDIAFVVAPATPAGLCVQVGPVYRCPECGVACLGLVSAEEAHAVFGGVPGWMRRWAPHVAYLRRAPGCEREGHSGGRVARLGAAILPLEWPDDESEEACIEALRQALACIARQVGPQGGAEDPAAGIVYRLLAGVLAPEAAVAEIRALVAGDT